MENITKQSIAKSIFYETGFPTSMALKMVDSIFNEIIDKLADGEAVKISNFGSFNIKSKKPRIGRNLNTGEDVTISARQVVSFSASDKLKQAINEKQE